MRSAFIQPPCKRQQLLIAANTTGSNHALPPGRSCHGRSSHDAQLHSVRAVVLLSRTSSRLQRQSNSTPPRALMNTDVAHGDALWALDARAAMLDLNTDAFRTVIESSQDNAWMAACEPERERLCCCCLFVHTIDSGPPQQTQQLALGWQLHARARDRARDRDTLSPRTPARDGTPHR